MSFAISPNIPEMFPHFTLNLLFFGIVFVEKSLFLSKRVLDALSFVFEFCKCLVFRIL